ncbi:carotenoid biosynthesis protein [Hymenobacter sp. HMF4947]|uniref:Carotenoid biosynthesis protein n=1 Tax=Hymenobacter ginkgonis TaxID=2682976 RepID=A0A7K1TC27_9BACT|nr:carotenoid biosynthesis protein [Hymenobacter ginkgonis]MVN75923.1 carotenoid biosynthesis protein [Hymenobacter ginkgonis]
MEFSNSPASAAASTTRLRLAQGLVLLFHLTGFVGLAFSRDKAFYLKYTPLTLLLTAALLAAFQQGRNMAFWLFVFQAFMLGMVAEIVGTNTGILFGHYTYGATLGPQYMGTPWLIGLNWVVVTCLAGTLAAYLPVAWWLRVLVGAVLMVGFDLCLEPVAGRYDFWHWTGELVPMRNFRDWFLLSLLLQLLFAHAMFPKRNALVPFVYLVQLLFFFVLSLLPF